jgi:hypothetical protein
VARRTGSSRFRPVSCRRPAATTTSASSKLQNELFVLGASFGRVRPAAGLQRQLHGCVAGGGQRRRRGSRCSHRYLRGFLGPQDMPDPTASLPPWREPPMHAPFRFIDGLGEDMLGYIFPAGDAVGIPSANNLDPLSDDRFRCHHSDDSESTSAQAGNIIGNAGRRATDRRAGRAPRLVDVVERAAAARCRPRHARLLRRARGHRVWLDVFPALR